jgi:hypothetical protein
MGSGEHSSMAESWVYVIGRDARFGDGGGGMRSGITG